MIGSLKGKIQDKFQTTVLIDVSGVGYIVYLPATELQTLKAGQEVFLHTYLSVKEDALDLFGSLEKTVIDWFKLLLSVKGIGPKSALAVMSLVKPKDLAGAIQTGKSDILIALGVGKKNAERIVLELKNKGMELSASMGDLDHSAMSVESEALSALESLGYSREQARDALSGIEASDVGDKIKAALKVLGRHN
ncbi:MAG: Holliday junction branch migration protein RuvA [Patescibacteria group bacterium]